MNSLKPYKMNWMEKRIYRDLRKEMMKYQEILKDYYFPLNKTIATITEFETLYGYKRNLGYFMIGCERGEIVLEYHTTNKEEFIVKWLDTNLYHYASEYVLKHREAFMKEWKYDIEYDERKYLFEFVIRALNQTGIPETINNSFIRHYTKLLNNKHENFWWFNQEKMEFIC